ncbi:MAG: UvrD-helicase domain-containing protein [Candidatus Cloacimonetes bacterium]|nr:UvrD-helicase domain-containing protein [Candidatus Cloacimonadota bacterium]
MKPRIIRASAGTGKTYRLSLEFIGLLLKYRETLSFEEIVVITFTRKATSEIRQRIISFLRQIVEKDAAAAELISSLQKFYPDLVMDKAAEEFLQKVYRQIITNKAKLNISTLDSFINQIFKSLIAPYHNIAEYDIDPLYNEKILPQLYEELLTDANFHWLQKIFYTTHSRNISSYDDFIKKILDERWLFEFYWRAGIKEGDSSAAGKIALQVLQAAAGEFCHTFSELLAQHYSGFPLNKIFPKDWLNVISKLVITEQPAPDDISLLLQQLLADEDFLEKNRSLAMAKGNIWNGTYLLKGNKMLDAKLLLTELQEDLLQSWKLYLYYLLAVPEQAVILQIAQLVFAKYDELKFREKVFTYSDLATYTWKYLYDPEISLIDNYEVLNIFYEQLAYRIRFILIDEFQDTSILQWNIFSPLISEIISGSGVSEIGSVIIVGDEKQAIYAWRSGERDLLNNMELMFPGQFASESLTTSYRNSLAIIQFVNRLFGNTAFTALTNKAGLDWKYEEVATNSKTAGYCRFQITCLSREDGNDDFENAVAGFIDNTYLPALETGQIDPRNTAILTRTRKEINAICSVLRERGIGYIDEAGNSLLQHRAVKPLLFLLRWFNNLDFYSLVQFLRSDLLLCDSRTLKEILVLWKTSRKEKTSFYLKLYNEFRAYPIVRILTELHQLRLQPLELAKTALRKLNFCKTFAQETDLVNLQKILDVIARQFLLQLDFPHDLSGLLRFLEEKESSEELLQAGIQQQDALKIMSIHKSKGLEFDTVILMLKSSSGRGGAQELTIYPDFDEHYANLTDCFFSYYFTSLIEATSRASLALRQQKKETIEAVNIWYVALTRAKRNLLGLFTYGNKNGIEGYLKEVDSDDLKTNKLMIHSLLSEFEKESVINGNDLLIEYGRLEKYQEKLEIKVMVLDSATDVSRWFEAPPADTLLPRDNWEKCLQPEILKAETHARLLGNLAHYYLEQIEFDEPRQRELALQATLNYYGNLIPADRIRSVAAQLQAFLHDNAAYFAEKYWDVVYREFAIFNDKKEEFRIDRLLVSHTRREIVILDYKTGRITDQWQLDNYKKIIKNIPFVKKHNYSVKDGIFLSINIS